MHLARAREAGWAGLSHARGIMRAIMAIMSKQQAPRYGPGKLVVDGQDVTVTRKATFALRPTASQERALHRLLEVVREVYNAALAERRDAWRLAGKTITWQDQFGQIKHLRGVRDDALAFGIQPVRSAIMRCEEALQAFFRRLGNGEAPGYPRFKGRRRYNSVCWDEPVSWKVDLDARILRIQGVGTIRLPKSARRQLARLAGRGGEPRTLSVTRRRAGGSKHNPRWVWRATVAFVGVAVERTPPARGALVGADRGVKVTLATSDAGMLAMPRYVAAMRGHIVDLERTQARKQRGSREWRRLGRKIARARRKAAAQVDAWARETANRLVADYEVIAVEDLALCAMLRSARGTKEEPGTNVAAKQGLNRELAAAALGRLAVRVCVKAESAGRRVWMVDARHTSQRCAACGHTAAANRPSQTTFACTACGHTANADVNAACNVAARGRECEQAWAAAGRTPLPRRTSRRRPKREPAQAAPPA
jgi:putative transposase